MVLPLLFIRRELPKINTLDPRMCGWMSKAASAKNAVRMLMKEMELFRRES